ncbi:glycoprotein I [Psittacid alphaherpesvirus 1]|uniref:Envelope glycoprotein I n=1 Tax=Psittacid herpesvirus 1 (isolate Amazon parrot/-/97-0001/1997) TaxID=670426 RepID=GI_PSHV1|nr:envelope glycoprotein I [Psittacid alphaherpesvirus 1]Q6UDF5.1 RecName: Full=Envelope glycoprotein I; Flags: Precursor [Psittacid herpesvirus 1 Amazon parrot/1997]AAQ73755.1 glycoprotein I [Psittacid alphaherpesvirus 1]
MRAKISSQAAVAIFLALVTCCLGTVIKGLGVSGVFEDTLVVFEKVETEDVGARLVFLGDQRPKNPYGGTVRVLFQPGESGTCSIPLLQVRYSNCTNTSAAVFSGCYRTDTEFSVPRANRGTSPGFVSLRTPTMLDSGDIYVTVHLDHLPRPDAFRIKFVSLYTGNETVRISTKDRAGRDRDSYGGASSPVGGRDSNRRTASRNDDGDLPLALYGPCRPCGKNCKNLREYLLTEESWHEWTSVFAPTTVAPTTTVATTAMRSTTVSFATMTAEVITSTGTVSMEPHNTTTADMVNLTAADPPPSEPVPALNALAIGLVVGGTVASLVFLSVILGGLISCCARRRSARRLLTRSNSAREMEDLAPSSEDARTSRMSPDVVELSELVNGAPLSHRNDIGGDDLTSISSASG